MPSNIRAPKSGFVPDFDNPYEHLKRVEWPKDLLGPNHWKLDPNLSDLSKELKEMAGRVTASAIRFYQKVKGRPANRILGDTTDPDTIHALKFALDRQDELETVIKPPKERLTELLMSWLQERKKSLVKSMEVVVVAEEGEMYDDTNREPWNMKIAKMTDEQVENLRLVFRRVMARIDAGPEGILQSEEIRSSYQAKTKVKKQGEMIAMPVEPKDPTWKIEESIMGNPTSKARKAALALDYQGRVFNVAWARMLATEDDALGEDVTLPLFAVISRALYLVMRNIDLVWMERPKGGSEEEEERLFTWLLEMKTAAMWYRLYWTEYQISPALNGKTVKFDNNGMSFIMENGVFEVWGKLCLA